MHTRESGSLDVVRVTVDTPPADAQPLTSCGIERAYVDKGYRRSEAPNPRRIFISGQKRGVFGVIKREFRRSSTIEPLIGHMKEEYHLGRCYLMPGRSCPLPGRLQLPTHPRLAESDLCPIFHARVGCLMASS
jgi:hypothetical protein